MTNKWYIIDDVNPEPWAIGPLGVGRRAGGYYPFVGPNKKLVAYKNAIREELENFNRPDFFDKEVQLTFFLWRQIEKLVLSSRTSEGHIADATNLQKALEDALQGTVFSNDRVVRDVRCIVVEQSRTTRPRIVIRASQWRGFNPDEIPQSIWNEIDKVPSLASVGENNSWKLGDEDVF